MHFLLADMTNLKLQHDQIKLSSHRLLLQDATLLIIQEKRKFHYITVPWVCKGMHPSLGVACWRISESRSDEKRREEKGIAIRLAC